jgi:hypothetical protein
MLFNLSKIVKVLEGYFFTCLQPKNAPSEDEKPLFSTGRPFHSRAGPALSLPKGGNPYCILRHGPLRFKEIGSRPKELASLWHK